MSKLIYLYDFKFYKDKELILYGYIQAQDEKPNNGQESVNWRKVEVLVKEYKIALQLNVDCNMFCASTGRNETYDLVENYLYRENASLKGLVKSYKQLDDFLPFKGAQTPENKQKIVEFEFEDFKSYEQFGRRINELNDKIINSFKNMNNSSQTYIDRLILKEKVHLEQFLLTRLDQYDQQTPQYMYIRYLINQFNKRPDKGSLFFETERQNAIVSQNAIKIDIINEIINNYKYDLEIVKFPFRMMEDDSRSNYILKLIRQSKCQLAGFNAVNLIDDEIEWPNDPTQRTQVYCNSLADIVFVQESPTQSKILNSCPLTLLCWDIEVCTESGKFDNDGKNPLNKVLCIGMSFGLIQAPANQTQHVNVCITWVDSKDNQVSITQFTNMYKDTVSQGNLFKQECSYVIRTSSEMEMIHAFFQLVNLLDPSFITGFNDYQFDFPFIRDKVSTFDVANGKFMISQLLYRGFCTQLPQTVQLANGRTRVDKRSFMGDIWCSQSIKINASDQRSGLSLDVMGIISIDTRILLMKMQKLEKKSLNDYLLANNLPTKLDVSFRDMNRAFKVLTTPVDDDMNYEQACQVMQNVFKYCIYDSEACYLLWNKRNILQQSVEVSKISYTPLKYSFLNADGIKVRNMVAKFAHDKGFSVPMTTRSQDIRIRDIDLLNKYQKYPGAYVSPPKKGISATPVSALDFSSLYPSIIMAHNLSPEKVVEPLEVIRSNMKTFKIEIPFTKSDSSEILVGEVLTRDHQPGVYPQILEFLFDSRKQVKTAMEALQEEADKTTDPQQKKELEFQTTLLNCKQLAIKVFMNTFYGETGNQKSPLFDVIISGGTTTLGQKYIKQVHHYIEGQDCEIVYGDTDSVYFRPRLSHFELFKKKKYANQQQDNSSLTSDLLASAYEATETLKAEINKRIGEQTSGFLKMAFEELLMPSMFTGKKKYCGVVYVPGKMTVKSSLGIKDILLRGIDFIKSQYPEIIKQVGYNTLISIMEHFMHQANDFNESQIKDLFADEYRNNLNLQLKELVSTQITNLCNRLMVIKPNDYQMLSSKKKLRSTKTGQMMLFRQRFTDISNNQSNFIFSSVKDFALQIDIQQLQQNGIAVPEDGEILDLISIKAPAIMSGLKASDLIHLMQYVKQRQLPINIQEYMNMYRTTASRILVSAFIDNTALSEGDQDIQEKHAIDDAKLFCDNISKSLLQDNKTIVQLKDPLISATISILNTTRHNLDVLVGKCLSTHNRLQLINDSPGSITIQSSLLSQINICPSLKELLYTLMNVQAIQDKLMLLEEQSQFQPDIASQNQQVVNNLQSVLRHYSEFQMLSVIIKTVYLINRETGNCTQEQVYVFLNTLIQVYEWRTRCDNLIKYTQQYNKLPPEMSEQQNWLFKQRLVYIDALKAQNKKIDKEKSSLRQLKSESNQIPIVELIEEHLLPGSSLVVDFFADSVWDLNYQAFKKDPSRKGWILQQIQLYKSGKLSNTKVLKIQKVDPDILA